jgi:hypothetical protein
LGLKVVKQLHNQVAMSDKPNGKDVLHCMTLETILRSERDERLNVIGIVYKKEAAEDPRLWAPWMIKNINRACSIDER